MKKQFSPKFNTKKGNLDEAIPVSNKLIDKISYTLSQEFEEKNRLYAYRQKIYDYLKRSIIYEIAHDRIDLADVKLSLMV